MKMLIFKMLTIVISVIFLSSCSTTLRMMEDTSGTKYKKMYTVKIDSKTRGLPVYYTEKGNERLLGFTPCNVYSDKAKIKYVTVRNVDEYQTVVLKTTPRASSYWNFVPYPMWNWIWGFFLDQGNGAGKTYSQKEYYVDF